MTHPIHHVAKRTLTRNFHCMSGCFALFLLASLVFIAYPQLDLWVSDLFYADHGNFPANDLWPIKGIYHGTPWAGRLLFVCSIALLLLAVMMPSKVSRRNWRRACALVAVVVLGIGLLVHTVLKDGMGRPRPRASGLRGSSRGGPSGHSANAPHPPGAWPGARWRFAPAGP